MNYLDELKEFAFLHAASQKMNKKYFSHILNKIDRIDGCNKGSWNNEFKVIADHFFAKKKYSIALQYYNLARFPFINSIEKKLSHRKCIQSFLKFNIVDQKFIYHESEKVPFYFKKNKQKNAPLLIVIGGIVSIKEQWFRLLSLSKILNFSFVLMEMPGVGENSCRYHSGSYSIFTTLINSLENEANTKEVHIVAMSFGGNMALKYAAHDSRIKSIFTVGAPLFHFFTDKPWWNRVPLITKKTLAHICQCDEKSLFLKLQDFKLTENELSKINIPIHYIFSKKDEIIPIEEKNYFRNFLNHSITYEFDDVHGSPNHMKEVQLILLRYLLNISGKKVLSSVINLILKLKRNMINE
jgi:esterase FrsA